MNIHRPEKTDKPWGNYEQFTLNEASTVKIITINIGEKLSLQTHKNREEFWKIISGHPLITLNSKKTEANPGDTFTVEKGDQHRIEAPTDGVSFLEISFGNFDEEDIVRLDDAYGRAHAL